MTTLYRGTYRVESTRLRDWDYRARGWYFVTICSDDRRAIFGRVMEGQMKLSAIGSVVDSELKTIPGHYQNVILDEHLVMPNHVHAIIMIDGEHCFTPNAEASVVTSAVFEPPRAGSLSAIVRAYKAGVTRKCHELGVRQEIWQPRFYDRLLRGDKVISAVRDYIRNNPANWAADCENQF